MKRRKNRNRRRNINNEIKREFKLSIAAAIVLFFFGTLAAWQLLATIADDKAFGMSARSYFENNYDYETRKACRDAAGNGRRANFHLAVNCAEQYIEERREREDRRIMNNLIKSETELIERLTKEIKRR